MDLALSGDTGQPRHAPCPIRFLAGCKRTLLEYKLPIQRTAKILIRLTIDLNLRWTHSQIVGCSYVMD